MNVDTLYFDHLGYASYQNMRIGRRTCSGFPEEYWIVRGDHPHDPDGDSDVVAGPRPQTLEEAMELVRVTRISDLKQELDRLTSE